MKLRSLLLAGSVLPLAFGPAASFTRPPIDAGERPVILVQDTAAAEKRVEDARKALQRARRALRQAESQGEGVEEARLAVERAEKDLRDARRALADAGAGQPAEAQVAEEAGEAEAAVQDRAAAEQAAPDEQVAQEELTREERRRLRRAEREAEEAGAQDEVVTQEQAVTQEQEVEQRQEVTQEQEVAQEELSREERRRLRRAEREAEEAAQQQAAAEAAARDQAAAEAAVQDRAAAEQAAPDEQVAQEELTREERRRLRRAEREAEEAGAQDEVVTQEQAVTQEQEVEQRQATTQELQVTEAEPGREELLRRREQRREQRRRQARRQGGDVTVNNVIQNEVQVTQEQDANQVQTATQEQAAEEGLTDEERRQRRRARLDDRREDERVDRLRDHVEETRGRLRETREELRDARILEGDEIVRRERDRIIVRRGDRIIIIADEDDRVARFGREEEVERLPNGNTRTVVVRDNGVRVVTVRNRQGDIIRRTRILPGGREIVLIDAGRAPERPRVDVEVNLPPLVVEIPTEEYIVESDEATGEEIEAALAAPPVEAVERVYTLEEVRTNERIRAKVRRVDLDTITFEFGSAIIPDDQLDTLEKVGIAIEDILFDRPDEVFLIEGHTDAVGSDLANLELSDRRAEEVAFALSDNFDIPPENLITQGYGEQDLKVPTESAERENRRVTIRRITPLVNPQVSQAQ